ncbi:MAG: UDP-3-O-(3-hydroxymyristoyl)glucosamine N-acyltransferase [Magnetococcales bacterium]|nr:UDP-3-O-(3-hydroxymyristoyl)glucosamine N-acyltransferase [Magnetococcales bacterium]
MKLSKLATDLGLEHLGGDISVSSVAPVQDAGVDHLSFVTAKKYLDMVDDIGALVVPPELANEAAIAAKPRLVSKVPALDVARAAKLLGQEYLVFSGIHPKAHVDPTATIGEGVSIGPGAVIGAGVVLGEGTSIHAGVVIYDRCEIGARCIIKANSVIGGEGFGYELENGSLESITHFGIVRIDDDVHIGSGTFIDRARFGATQIGSGTRIDNAVHIAHNVQVGRSCIIVAQVGISGSCIIEDGVLMGGQVGCVPHVTIGAGARIGASTGVISDVPAGITWTGWFGQPHRKAMAQVVASRKLPDFMKKVQDFMKKFEEKS